MKKSSRSLGSRLALLTLSLAPLSATAGEGYYLGLEAGAAFPKDQTFKAARDFGPIGSLLFAKGDTLTRQGLDTGPLGGVTFGYKFASGLRPELELSYTQSKFGGAEYLNSGTKFQSGGKEAVGSAFANLWIDLLKDSRLQPYLGAGVGIAYVDVRKPDFIGVQLGSDSDTVFAYQGGAGLIFEASEQIDLALDYRYISSSKGRYDLDGEPVTRSTMRYESQSAMLSLRYYFDSPTPPPPPPAPEPAPVVVTPPPPPPPPAPCESDPSRSVDLSGCKVGDTVVLRGVNFDFDKASLTLDAKSQLDKVVEALTARADIKVQVAGHTDALGSDEYNQKLSERRAASVVEYLSAHGIDGGRLAPIGYGESRPVADNGTDEGREQNRRVELNVTEATGQPVATEAAAPAAEAPLASTDAPPAGDAAAPAAAEAVPPAAVPVDSLAPAAEPVATP